MEKRRVLKFAAAVFLVSLVIRLTWAAFAHVTPISDFRGYDGLALQWLHTGVFGEPGSYAYRTPGYPAFLAAIYRLVGHSPRAAGFVQAFIGALTSGLLVLLAGRILSPRAGALAGLLHAVSPTAVAYVPVLASETIAAFLLVAALLCLAAAEEREERERDGRGALVGSGLLFGLMMLVRPAALFFLPAAALLSVYSPRRRRWIPSRGLIFAAAVLLVLGPWMIRNQRLGLGWMTISTVGGENLWMGNNDKARLGGFCAEAAWPVKPGDTEQGRDRAYRRAARAWILHHPGRYLALSAIRAWRLFGVEPDTWAAKYLWPTRGNDRVFAAVYGERASQGGPVPEELRLRAGEIEMRHALFLKRLRWLLAPLVLLALLVTIPWWRDYAVVTFPALSYLGGLSLTYAEIRFRELSDPLLMIPLAGLLAMAVFRSTELAREPLHPSRAFAIILRTLRSLSPGAREREALPPAPISRREAEERAADCAREAAGHPFSPIDLAQPGLRPAALWNYPAWTVSASRFQEGIRCLIHASADLSAEQRGGLTLPAGPFRALRLILSFINPRGLREVRVEARDGEGRMCAGWRWEVAAESLPPVARQHYVLLPGKPSWYFEPEETDGPSGEPAELRLLVRVASNAKAGFVLHRAELTPPAVLPVLRSPP